jgi:hypothetical protein
VNLGYHKDKKGLRMNIRLERRRKDVQTRPVWISLLVSLVTVGTDQPPAKNGMKGEKIEN